MEKPILFSAPMVKAILGGRKTMTRRVVDPQFTALWGQGIRAGHEDAYSIHVNIMADDGSWKWLKCPYGKPGDTLWVRETFAVNCVGGKDFVFYRADCGSDGDGAKWKPSIFMPRKYSRITLRITDVRAERLQEISEADAIAEGLIQRPDWPDVQWACVNGNYWRDPRQAFRTLWDSINEKRGYGWHDNPWVWIVSFEKV